MHRAGPRRLTGRPDASAYAPFALTADGARWSLERRTVSTRSGTAVVHHRPGPRPMLLVHGVAGSWTTFTPLLSAGLGAGRSAGLGADDGADLGADDGAGRGADDGAGRGLVLVDMPGWGETEEPPTPLDVDAAVSVMVAVLDALALPSVDVVGHSMGAFLGLHLAVRDPERVATLTLVSPTTFSVAEVARHPVTGVVRLPAYALLRAGLALTRGAARPMLRALAGIGLLRLFAAPVFTHVRRLDRSVLDAFVAELRPVGFLAAAREAARYDTSRWGSIRCPVTVVAGEDDVFARATDRDRLAVVVPRTRVVVLPDCGHFAHVEHPEAVARLLA